jgi:hypothetical protein
VALQYCIVIDIRAADGNTRQHGECAMPFAVARKQHDAMTIGRKPRHQIAADETGSAKDDDALRSHGEVLLQALERISLGVILP